MSVEKETNTGIDNSGDYNSGYYNSGDYNSGYYNSGDYNSGYYNSGNLNSGNHNSGDRNSGYYNSGNYNSGNYNSGNHNSGHFNTDEPTVRMFGKDTGKKRDEILLFFIDLKLNEWVSENEMTGQEKIDNPKFYITKGYLKTIPYKDAWKKYWDSATDQEKEQFKTLPNFDSAIFYEITGIDVAVNTDKMKKDMIVEAEELMKKGMELLNKAKGIC